MSCNHGNWPPCDLCDEVDAAYNSGHKHGYEKGGEHFADLTLKHLRRAETAETALAQAESRLRDVEARTVEMFSLLASAWFYGGWKAETANERRMQEIMMEAGYWPIESEEHLLSLRALPVQRGEGE